VAVSFRRLEGAWEVASGVYCLGPLGRTQTNVYLVDAGTSWALVDTGWARDASSIKAAADARFGVGVPPAAVVLTHCHPDHAGSALELGRTWDCPVYVHPLEVPIATGDFAAMAEYAGPLDTWVVPQEPPLPCVPSPEESRALPRIVGSVHGGGRGPASDEARHRGAGARSQRSGLPDHRGGAPAMGSTGGPDHRGRLRRTGAARPDHAGRWRTRSTWDR